MENVTIAQEVKEFIDLDDTCTQEVHIDTSDPSEDWVVVSHAGNELSMSLAKFESNDKKK